MKCPEPGEEVAFSKDSMEWKDSLERFGDLRSLERVATCSGFR